LSNPHNTYPESDAPDPEKSFRLWFLEAIHLKTDHLKWKRYSERAKRVPVTESQENEHVRAPHNTLVMGPYPGREPIDGITTVYFRTLTQYYFRKDKGKIEMRETPPFSDTFVEVIYGPDEPHRYFLVNTREISEYDDLNKIRRNPDYEDSGDLFIHMGEVIPPADGPQRPALTAMVLLAVLEKYAALEQDNS